ncbi:hypothetical protein OKT22_18480 [Providencia rettgeri]|uniref:hypothetical protein n=1 Tax=Providencia rettgeri TaxID=587 RepID=UPI00226D9465|nr:hypothetical protein [Providencia rettgeri]MCX9111002.1 hypothetical protein [Providencia rettgeri]
MVRAVETRVSGYALFNAPYPPPALCATLKTLKGAVVVLSSRLSPFSTFGEPVSAPQTGARTGVYGEPAPTVCKWGQSGVRLNTGSTPV